MKWKIGLSYVFLGIVASSCVTLHRVTPPLDEMWNSVMINQEVDVLMNDGEQIRRLAIKSKTEEELTGEVKGKPRTLRRADIKALESSFSDTRKRQQVTLLEPGVQLKLTLNTSKVIRMKYARQDETKIYGKKGSRDIEFSFSEIKEIVVRRPSPGGTVACVLLVGIIVLIYVEGSTGSFTVF